MRKKFVLLAFVIQLLLPVGANLISYSSIAMPYEHIEANISSIEEKTSVASITHPPTITIFEIKLDVNMTFDEGANLTFIFYTYSNVYQANTTVWNGTTPAHVDLSMNVPHTLDNPLDWNERVPVENATLVLTDYDGTIISSITTFVMTRRHLWDRLGVLDVWWNIPIPRPPIPIKWKIFFEMVYIDGQWPYAPP